VQSALAAEVVGGVDDGLDAQRPAVLQVLLDAGVFVEGVHGDLGAAGDDLGLELASTSTLSAADLPVKTISMVSGRPRSRLSVTRASKKPRA
jgi:hypothetical protein